MMEVTEQMEKPMNISDYLDGWIVGDFIPSLIKTKDTEIGLRRFAPYEYEGFYHRRDTTEYIILVNGQIRVNGKELLKGDIVKILPGEDYDILPLSFSEVLIVKNHSGADRFYRKGIEFSRLEGIFYDVYSKIADDEFKASVTSLSNAIDFSDISVVVQGAIDEAFTGSCLESVRKYLPGSRIILSTWKGSDTVGLDYDELILSDDPGSVKIPTVDGGIFNYNINRQTVSSRNGIRAADSKYILKIRSDVIAMGNDFLRFFDKYSRKKEEFSVFEERLMVSEIFTLDWEVHQNSYCKFKFYRPYHVSDMVIFGKRTDMQMFFESIPMYEEDEVLRSDSEDRKYKMQWTLPPEQFYVTHVLAKKYPDVYMKDLFDYDEDSVKRSYEYVMNNFIILNTMQYKMMCPKYARDWLGNNGKTYAREGILKNSDFIKYYERL